MQLRGLKGLSQVEIYNMLGEKCHSFSVNGPVSGIDLSELPDAVYYLKIKNEDCTISKTFIKR